MAFLAKSVDAGPTQMVQSRIAGQDGTEWTGKRCTFPKTKYDLFVGRCTYIKLQYGRHKEYTDISLITVYVLFIAANML